MTRDEFLREMKENLVGKTNTNEITDILDDYTEYFDAGIREGGTEEEICNQLGSPTRIIETLLEEGPVNTSVDRVSITNSSDLGQTLKRDELDIAPLPNRLLAFMIDNLINASLLAVLTRNLVTFLIMPLNPLLVLYMDPVITIESSLDLWIHRLWAILALAFFVFYPIVCLVILKGRTLGKLVMKIKIVRQDGLPLRIIDILAREIIGKLIVNVMSLGFASLGSFIWSLVSAQHKTVHDVIAGTRVVNATQRNDD